MQKQSNKLSSHHSSLLKNYKRLGRLGEGSFSDVILIETVPEKKLIALKRLKININDDPAKLLNEVNVLSSLEHPNIIKCLDYEKEMLRISIALEYCDDGDLSQRIMHAKINSYFLKESVILQWIVQLFLAVDYLHTHHILHRDIKPQNIFLMKNGLVKLGDFGIAKELHGEHDFTKTKLGTPYYLAPEICLGQSYSYPADVWMSGVVVYELMTLIKPFEEKSLQAVVNRIVNEEYTNIEGNYSEELKDLVARMLEKKPENRITIKEILTVSFISKEIQKIKEEFSNIYQEKNYGVKKNQAHGISFQQYLENKLQNFEEKKTGDTMVNLLKNREIGKGLPRYHSLPAENFEIYRRNTAKRRISTSKKRDIFDKTPEKSEKNEPEPHFEQFLQENILKKTKEYPEILRNIIGDDEKTDCFMCEALSKPEFINKIKEICKGKCEETALEKAYEEYSSFLQ